MKIRVNILVVISSCICLFFPAVSTAEDYPMEQSRRKIWNLLQEQRPDYYNERPDVKASDSTANEPVGEEADPVIGEYKVDKIAYYDKVELSKADLTQQQNDYIYASVENEDLNTVADWSADAGEKDSETYTMDKPEAVDFVQPMDTQKASEPNKIVSVKTDISEPKVNTEEVKKVVPAPANAELAKKDNDTTGNKGNVMLIKTGENDQSGIKLKEESDNEEVNFGKMLKTFQEEDADNDAEEMSETEDIEDEYMDAEELEEKEESVWIKMKRKMSPSGMLKEEVAELEYWDVPVEEQSIDNISRNLKIENAFKDAAMITLPDAPEGVSKSDREPVKSPIVTTEEIIRNAIPQGYREKRIDLDFDDTNLSDILLIMGDAGNMNIVLDPALKSNTLDLHLKQIKLEDALLLVANSYDLGFKLVGNALFITEKEKLRFENKISRIIKVKNINVQEAKQLVDELADKVNVSEELNSLIVIGDPEDVVNVEKLVREIDQPQPQVVLEAKIIEVNKDALKDLGIDWSDQVNLLYQESGRPQDFDDVEESSSPIYRIAQIQRNPLQFASTIRMLEQQNKAKVLSAPRVTTLNGKEAVIFVGDEVPYTITNITGGVVTNDVRFVEPGIRLRITPSIIEDGFVVMKVEPEVSFIVTFRGPNDEFPQVRTREATAHVRVNNKQPFVLGGILNQEDKQSLFKVPFFGKLPLFGNLFSYEKSTAVDTELIITVVPTVVHGQE
ncbi:MAG: type II secretion system protein GspD [Candidatus Omnitrophota bacterium]